MKLSRFVMFICVLLFLVGCSNEQPTPTAVAGSTAPEEPEPTAQPTIAATHTTVPTDKATAVPPTNTPTLEPTQTATLPPTDTPTSTATETAEPTETATLVPTTAATTPPQTPTAVSISAPAPPPAPAPTGPNLLSNPGFENGKSSWEKTGAIYEVGGSPQFVHSGSFAMAHHGGFRQSHQYVNHSIVPGTTYRAGVWVKLWSSSGIDRTVSENPGDFVARICINGNGDNDLARDETFCSSWVRPIDVWQFISVDAVATERGWIAVILQSGFSGPNSVIHNEAIWDDATLGVAPAPATATPVPVAVVRPAPIPFEATALRDNMNAVRSQIEQMGGVLDRMYNGEAGKCEEYQDYYKNIILSTTYDGIPSEWQTIYNDYIFAVENAITTNESLNGLCDSGGGTVTALNYGTARQGINSSLDRLIPAIEAANGMLGG